MPITKPNSRPDLNPSSIKISIRAQNQSESNRNSRLLGICVNVWKQSCWSNSNRNKNALFPVLPVSIFLALCGLLSACGSTSSSPATAATTPVITIQPASVSVTVGQPATFTVAATGTAPLSYQWTKNGSNVGMNSATYSTAATTSADNGAKIQVTVSNSKGSTPSSMITLTVNATATKPAITTQPMNTTVSAGKTATFTVAASGTATLSYQWTKNGADVGTNS